MRSGTVVARILPGSTSETRRSVRLLQVLGAATKLFERNGYHTTTMQDIAAEAGISVGLIYQYASNKEDVLLLVITEILQRYMRELPRAMAPYRDPVERVAAGFAAYCAIVDQRRGAAVLAYRETKTLSPRGRERLKTLESATTALLAAEVTKAVQAGAFVRADGTLVAYDLMMLAHGWALKHWYLARTMSLDDYIAFQCSLFFRSLIAPGKRSRYRALIERGRAPNGARVSKGGRTSAASKRVRTSAKAPRRRSTSRRD